MNNQTDKLLSKNESNPLYNIYNENQLLYYNYDSNSFYVHGEITQLFSKFESILRKPRVKKLLLWFLENKATTMSYLVDHQGYDNNVHRDVAILERHGFVKPYFKIKAKDGGGPKPILYGLPDLSTEVIAETTLMIQRKNQKIFRHVDVLVQKSLDEVRDEEIQFTKIMRITRMNASGYHYKDLADVVAEELQSKYKVRVWRSI